MFTSLLANFSVTAVFKFISYVYNVLFDVTVCSMCIWMKEKTMKHGLVGNWTIAKRDKYVKPWALSSEDCGAIPVRHLYFELSKSANATWHCGK